MTRSAEVLVLAVLALLLGAARADAYWLREEWVGYQAETGRLRLRFGDFAAYESETGLGLGAEAFELNPGPWDVSRVGRPDASAHALYEVMPLKAYLALLSWRGPTYLHMLDSRAKDRSIGKVELFASYCDWATLTQFNEADPLGPEFGRQDVAGSLRARVVDYGLRLDQGLGGSIAWTASVGRFEMTAYADGPFRRRDAANWYAAVEIYFGTTKGTDYGGGIGRLLLRAGDEIGALFGGSVVHREPLPSTTPAAP